MDTLSFIHHLMRGFAEVPALSVLRQQMMWREALAEDKFVKRVSTSLGAKRFDIDSLNSRLKRETRDVFYILGSGSSIEDLAEADFDAISRGISVGINAWALHDFVPDIYAFEPVPERESDHYSTMQFLQRDEVVEREPAVMFLKPRTPIESEQLAMIHPALQRHTFLYGRFQPFTRLRENLARDLNVVWKLVDHHLSVLPDSGASIVRMAFLGFLLGFRTIVFVGVDLSHTEYFWEKNPKYLKKFGLSSFSSGQKENTHETLVRENRAFGVIDMVLAFRDFASKHGVTVEVASPRSLLARELPVHEFPAGHSMGSRRRR